jgi:hypothetical protein
MMEAGTAVKGNPCLNEGQGIIHEGQDSRHLQCIYRSFPIVYPSQRRSPDNAFSIVAAGRAFNNKHISHSQKKR